MIISGMNRRFVIHDKESIELKLSFFPFIQERKHRKFRFNIYFFIPKQLEINESTYSSAEFYKDLKNYVRLQEPNISLKRLVDDDCNLSPLFKLSDFLDNLHTVRVKDVIKEVKLFGVIFRARIKEEERRVFDYINENLNKKKYESIEKYIKNILNLVEEIKAKYRKLKKEYEKQFPYYSGEVAETFKVVDEYISTVSEALFALITRSLMEVEELSSLVDYIREIFQKEYNYRKKNKFKLIPKKFENERESEYYMNLFSNYKKIVSSVLFLEITKRIKWKKYVHLVAAIAAALAMLIYLVVTLPFSGSSAIILTLFTISYVIKDRVKESVRQKLEPYLLKYFPDFEVDVKDLETNEIIAHYQEKFRYFSLEEIESEVIGEREKMQEVKINPLKEIVMLYSKSITIDSDKLLNIHKRTIGITDILRLNISKFLKKMDDPTDVLHYFSPVDGHPIRRPIPRVYFIDVVIKYVGKDTTSDGSQIDKTLFERYRMVLDRNGIKRIEKF